MRCLVCLCAGARAGRAGHSLRQGALNAGRPAESIANTRYPGCRHHQREPAPHLVWQAMKAVADRNLARNQLRVPAGFIDLQTAQRRAQHRGIQTQPVGAIHQIADNMFALGRT